MQPINLTIPLANVSALDALEDWAWLLQKPLRPIFLSKFGDWFFFNVTGGVEMLDMIEGELQQIAANDQEFNALCKSLDLQSRWFLDGWVYRMESDGKMLEQGQCYGFKIPPFLGGRFDVDNIEIYSIPVYNSICGQLFRQIGFVP